MKKKTVFNMGNSHVLYYAEICSMKKKHCYTGASSGSHWLNCYNVLITNR